MGKGRGRANVGNATDTHICGIYAPISLISPGEADIHSLAHT